MIVPRMTLDGATPLDSHRRTGASDGQFGAYSPRPRSTSEPSNVDGILPSHHGASAAAMPSDDGFVRRSVSMPLARIVGGADEEDSDGSPHLVRETWNVRGEVVRQNAFGTNSAVPLRLCVGDCRVNGRQLLDPRHLNRATPRITSLALSHEGSSLAYGDHSGKLYVLGALPKTLSTKRSGAVGSIFPVQGDANRSKNDSSNSIQRGSRHSRYAAQCGANAYSAVIDPLNSVPVTPAITSLAFVPREGPSNLLITVNEKVPKLFRITENYDTPQASFKAVDLMGTKMIGPLISTSRTHGHSIRQVHRYGMDHEYNVNSVSPTIDGAYFYTSDELSVRLWSVEHSDSSVEVVTLPKPTDDDGGDESAKETIMRTRMFAQEPSLCFLSTSAGNVRVCDTRESLRWTNRLSHQVFSNPSRDMYDGKYAGVTNALTGGCSLSPCGRYIAARDFFSVIMWDVRKVSAPNSKDSGLLGSIDQSIVRRWELHPQMRQHMDSLYASNMLFERFGIDFSSSLSSSQTGCIVTGGLGGTVFAIDPLSTADSADEPYPEDSASILRAAEASMKGVRAFVLPDPADLATEQRAASDARGDDANLSDPYFHTVASRGIPFSSRDAHMNDRELELESRRVAHVSDSNVEGGGVWVTMGEFLAQLIV